MLPFSDLTLLFWQQEGIHPAKILPHQSPEILLLYAFGGSNLTRSSLQKKRGWLKKRKWKEEMIY